MTGGEDISAKKNVSPNAAYNLAGVGRGTGNFVMKGEKGLVGGPQKQYSDHSVGTKAYRLTDKSLNSGRKM